MGHLDGDEHSQRRGGYGIGSHELAGAARDGGSCFAVPSRFITLVSSLLKKNRKGSGKKKERQQQEEVMTSSVK